MTKHAKVLVSYFIATLFFIYDYYYYYYLFIFVCMCVCVCVQRGSSPSKGIDKEMNRSHLFKVLRRWFAFTILGCGWTMCLC